jgi:hypothetical protein
LIGNGNNLQHRKPLNAEVMKSKINLVFIVLLFILHPSFAQSLKPKIDKDSSYKYRLSIPLITLFNIGQGGKRTNTQHLEFHFKYKLNAKSIVGVKFATWRLFQPMGILWWDGLMDKVESQSEFYPGYLRETGLGIAYQRMIWKGLFATVEVLPQLKTYLNEDYKKTGNDFKLYTSYHLGYHIPLIKNRIFFEPQIHCQNWMIDTNTPASFKELDKKWKTYFLFEPSIYLGVKF